MFDSRESFDDLAERLDYRGDPKRQQVVPINRTQLALWRRQADILDLFADAQSLAKTG